MKSKVWGLIIIMFITAFYATGCGNSSDAIMKSIDISENASMDDKGLVNAESVKPDSESSYEFYEGTLEEIISNPDNINSYGIFEISQTINTENANFAKPSFYEDSDINFLIDGSGQMFMFSAICSDPIGDETHYYSNRAIYSDYFEFGTPVSADCNIVLVKDIKMDQNGNVIDSNRQLYKLKDVLVEEYGSFFFSNISPYVKSDSTLWTSQPDNLFIPLLVNQVVGNEKGEICRMTQVIDPFAGIYVEGLK